MKKTSKRETVIGGLLQKFDSTPENKPETRETFETALRKYFGAYESLVAKVSNFSYTRKLGEFMTFARETISGLRVFEENYAFASQGFADRANRLPYGRMEAKHG